MNILNKLTMLTVLVSIFMPTSSVYAENQDEIDATTIQYNDEQKDIYHVARTAHIDPNTGKLTSTPDETNSKLPTTNVVQGSLPAVEMLYHANGTVQAKLNGRFRTPLVAQINCEGKIIMTHAENRKIDAVDCGDSK